ncbi:hypothetical protein, partial [Rhizobium leguminosarum]|uniref:hypothetical protein n=1 Tax=Rhizobium leguminosarum TaxID=384 RepID=UPI003F98E0FF
MAAHIILRLDDVSKVYSGIVAVKRANLERRRGAVNVLVGENGAGKPISFDTGDDLHQGRLAC